MNEKQDVTKLEEPMRTAKELAFKAYCHNLPKDEDIATARLQERFNNWWSEWFHGDEHRGCFRHDYNVYVEGRRYIRAE